MLGFWDILFPKRCVGCNKWGSYVCEKCEVGLWEVEQVCPECNRTSEDGLTHKQCKKHEAMEGLICLWAYEGAALMLIKEAKSKRYYDYLEALLVNKNELRRRIEFSNFIKFLEANSVVTSVPLDWEEERERGFNQAEIIARLISRNWHLVYKKLLIKNRNVKQQAINSKEERQKAGKGVFQMAKQISCPGVVLVDDVWKTGTTMRECAKVLKKAGVKQVWGLVMAR